MLKGGEWPGENSQGPDVEQNRQREMLSSLGRSAQGVSKNITTPIQELLFITILCGAQVITQAGLGMSIAPLQKIADSFGTQGTAGLSWATAAYSMTVGTFILISGRLGDVYGHKKLLIFGFLWFALWSLIAGFSVYSTQILFDSCRAFQGIGAAIFLPNAIAILGTTYTGSTKGIMFAIFGACAPGGFVIGALFASLLAERVWWPWAFWIMAITCVTFACGGYVCIPSKPPSAASGSIFMRLDIAGSVTGVTGMVLINVAWNQGPLVGWSTPYTYVLLIAGFLAIGIFTVIEHYTTFPLLPLHLLTKECWFVLACIAAGWSSFGIWVFFSWEFVELLRQKSPVTASVEFIPAVISGIIAAMTSGLVMNKIHASYIMLASMLAFLSGTILMATVPVEQTYWQQLFVSVMVMPWGMDLSFPAATMLMSEAMHHDHQGTSASLVMTVINYSISMGLGIAATVSSQVANDPADILMVYRSSWYTGIGLSGLGVVISSMFVSVHWLKSRSDSSS